jgi:translation initiation factor 1
VTDRVVYSTAHGRMCPGCGRPIAECVCREQTAVPQGDGIVRVSRETKGRRGKTVTTVTGLPLDQKELQRLAKDLKRTCGAGGTVKETVIEVQGDHRDMLIEELRARGYTAKRSGG